jgi:hypothetical protein
MHSRTWVRGLQTDASWQHLKSKPQGCGIFGLEKVICDPHVYSGVVAETCQHHSQ